MDLAATETPGMHIIRDLPPNARRIGVLAGSFNPLTHGHEALIDAARRAGIDATLLLLPLQAIDKAAVSRASLADRVLVAAEWAEHRGNVGVGLINRGLYAEQADLLATIFPHADFAFLVGFDKIGQILDPRYYTDRDAALDNLFARASCVVAPRLGQTEADLQQLLIRDENRRYSARISPLDVDASVDAVSSTLVREAAREGRDWERLVPPETTAFLKEARPYSEPMRLPDGEEIDIYGLRLALLEAGAAGRLGAAPDFAHLCRTASTPTPEGKKLRQWLAGSSRKR